MRTYPEGKAEQWESCRRTKREILSGVLIPSSCRIHQDLTAMLPREAESGSSFFFCEKIEFSSDEVCLGPFDLVRKRGSARQNTAS